MAQHDFAPAWLNFPTPPSTTKHPESPGCQDSRYGAIRRRHNSSDAFDSNPGFSSVGNFGRKERPGWRSQSRSSAEIVNTHMAYSDMISRTHSSTFHGGKSFCEDAISETDEWKDDRERRNKFQAENFPSLYPGNDVELNQAMSLSAGIWEYPFSTKCGTSPTLDLKDFQLSGYPIGSSTFIPSKNWPEIPTSLSPKRGTSPLENYPSEEKNLESEFCSDSACGSFGPTMSIYDDFLVVHHRQESDDGPLVVDSVGVHDGILQEGAHHKVHFPPHADWLDHQEKVIIPQVIGVSGFNNRIGSCHEEDLNQSLDINEATNSKSVTAMSSMLPQEGVLSSSLEAEHRLLKEMGWQEDVENDDIYAPLTEDELREFQAVCKQSGLRKSFLKNCLSVDLMFAPLKNSAFLTEDEAENSDTSSSDTSDDDV